jgi:hypothetical protein
MKYFEYVLPKMDYFFEFYMKKNFRGLKFKTYCLTKKYMTEICKDIVGYEKKKKNEIGLNKEMKCKKTLVGFGDFSNNGIVKGNPKAPVLKFKRELKNWCELVEINEYRTSKTCNECHKEIELMKHRDVIKKNRKYKKNGKEEENKEKYEKKEGISDAKREDKRTYSVIRCKNNGCRLYCMDRDINASKNILNILIREKEGLERDECFKKQKANTNVKHEGDKGSGRESGKKDKSKLHVSALKNKKSLD